MDRVDDTEEDEVLERIAEALGLLEDVVDLVDKTETEVVLEVDDDLVELTLIEEDLVI